MVTRYLIIGGLTIICNWLTSAYSQVPETGRWQSMEFSSAAVNTETAARYHEHLTELNHQIRLDQDKDLLRRLQQISKGLIAAAGILKPESKHWNWEIHVTAENQVDAYCMAGGKILIGSQFVRQLHLNNAELATLLGHEMAHAVAEHHREELSEALHINAQPGGSLDIMMGRLDTDFSMQLKLATLSAMQESEADQLGMILAHLAGWPSASMVRFYEKLQATEGNSVIAGSYPSASSRLSMAKGLSKLWSTMPPKQIR